MTPDTTMPVEKLDSETLEQSLHLWFFRDLSSDQRMGLFELCLYPIEELSTHGVQQAALRQLIRDLAPYHPAATQKLEVAEQFPENLLSHRSSWLHALERLVELEPESFAPDMDEKGYWRHELAAMRKMYAEVDELTALVPAPQVTVSDDNQ